MAKRSGEGATEPIPNKETQDPGGNSLGRKKILVGISSCLLGDEVRFDGGHKFDAYINGTLADYFEFVPVCPEVAIGLGVPREPIRLVGDPHGPRAIGVRNPNLDVTEKLETYGRETAARLHHLCGYILKRASPSCGMERVKIYSERGMPSHTGAGLFARELMRALPLLPVEEEGRLGDPGLRENFISRVLIYHRWRERVNAGLTVGAVHEFHARHKLVIMSHNQTAARRLGRMAAEMTPADLPAQADAYIAELMATLKRPATRKNHCNVLQHLMGYLKNQLDADDKAELLETFDAYARGELPLIVPVTLLKHHFRRHPHEYVAQQVYLNPHPQELMLRNRL